LYPGCYSDEVYATYEVFECLNGGKKEELTFTLVGGEPAGDSCSFSKMYCNAFRISDQPLASTLTNDDTCANLEMGVEEVERSLVDMDDIIVVGIKIGCLVLVCDDLKSV
jgi:hypothetical protein